MKDESIQGDQGVPPSNQFVIEQAQQLKQIPLFPLCKKLDFFAFLCQYSKMQTLFLINYVLLDYNPFYRITWQNLKYVLFLKLSCQIKGFIPEQSRYSTLNLN